MSEQNEKQTFNPETDLNLSTSLPASDEPSTSDPEGKVFSKDVKSTPTSTRHDDSLGVNEKVFLCTERTDVVQEATETEKPLPDTGSTSRMQQVQREKKATNDNDDNKVSDRPERVKPHSETSRVEGLTKQNRKLDLGEEQSYNEYNQEKPSIDNARLPRHWEHGERLSNDNIGPMPGRDKPTTGDSDLFASKHNAVVFTPKDDQRKDRAIGATDDNEVTAEKAPYVSAVANTPRNADAEINGSQQSAISPDKHQEDGVKSLNPENGETSQSNGRNKPQGNRNTPSCRPKIRTKIAVKTTGRTFERDQESRFKHMVKNLQSNSDFSECLDTARNIARNRNNTRATNPDKSRERKRNNTEQKRTVPLPVDNGHKKDEGNMGHGREQAIETEPKTDEDSDPDTGQNPEHGVENNVETLVDHEGRSNEDGIDNMSDSEETTPRTVQHRDFDTEGDETDTNNDQMEHNRTSVAELKKDEDICNDDRDIITTAKTIIEGKASTEILVPPPPDDANSGENSNEVRRHITASRAGQDEDAFPFLQRLATFNDIPIEEIRPTLPQEKLAKFGVEHVPGQQVVECTSCHKKHTFQDIENSLGNEWHENGCEFAGKRAPCNYCEQSNVNQQGTVCEHCRQNIPPIRTFWTPSRQEVTVLRLQLNLQAHVFTSCVVCHHDIRPGQIVDICSVCGGRICCHGWHGH